MDKFLVKKEEPNTSGEWLCASKKPSQKPKPKPAITRAIKREKASADSAFDSAAKKCELWESASTSTPAADNANKKWKPSFPTVDSKESTSKKQEQPWGIDSFSHPNKVEPCMPSTTGRKPDSLCKHPATASLSARMVMPGPSSSTNASRKSDLLPREWKSVVKKLCSPSFQEEYQRAALQVFDKTKEVSALQAKGGSIRNAETRVQLMHGYDCECCAPYYDALNLSPGERQRRVNQVSRHRAFAPIPRTPPRYWDINFPSLDEQKRLGLLVETNSPLFKKNGPKRKMFKKTNSR